MAIFSVSVGVVGRSKGRQVCAAAAYQARTPIFDERQGIRFQYSNRDGEELLAAEILRPAEAPPWDRQMLWNMAERVERRKDAQTARTIRLALPRELALDQMLALLRDFLKVQFVDRGLAVDFAIHDKTAADGGRQPHAHVLVSLRRLSPEGFCNKKDRTTFCGPRQLIHFRAEWAAAANQALLTAGHDCYIDFRSLADQRRCVESMIADPTVTNEDRRTLAAALHRLSRRPEPKVPACDWQHARRKGELPPDVRSARVDAQRASIEADKLYTLLRERDLVREKPDRPEQMQSDPKILEEADTEALAWTAPKPR